MIPKAANICNEACFSAARGQALEKSSGVEPRAAEKQKVTWVLVVL
jgi:hypothetical protein